MKAALDRLAADAVEAAKKGAKIIILSDRKQTNHDPLTVHHSFCVPSLLAVSAVNKALTEAGLRSETGLVVESGEVLEVHHFAVLLGFGATAINPYLALVLTNQTNSI